MKMATNINKINFLCPVCKGKVKVREIYCEDCDLTLRGDFEPDMFAALSSDEQKFVFDFVLNDGSLKDMSKHLGKSYPTVRHMLDEVTEKLKVGKR